MNVFNDSKRLSAGVALPATHGKGGPNGVRGGVPGEVYTDDLTQLVWICDNQVNHWFVIGPSDDVTVIQTNGGANTPDGVVASGPALWYGADLSVWLKSNKTFDSGGWAKISNGVAVGYSVVDTDPLLPEIHLPISGTNIGDDNILMSAEVLMVNNTFAGTKLTWNFLDAWIGVGPVGGALGVLPTTGLFLQRSSTNTDMINPTGSGYVGNFTGITEPAAEAGWTTIHSWPAGVVTDYPTTYTDADAPSTQFAYRLVLILGPNIPSTSASLQIEIEWNIAISKVTTSGNTTYFQLLGSTTSGSGQALGKDANGNIYLGGYWVGDMNLGPVVGTISSTAGHQSGFLAKINNVGVAQWATQFKGAGAVNVTAVALDSSGNIFVGGYFSGTIDFGGGSVTSSYANDMFIVKLNSAGTHVWDKQFGSQGLGQGFDSVTSLAADAAGNIVVGGFMQGNNINFGGGIHYNGAGGFDSCLFKLAAANGAHLWSRLFAADTDNQVNGVAVDSNGDVVVCGKLIGSVDLSNNTGQLPYPHTANTLTTSGGSDGYVGKFDTNGNYMWSIKIGAFLNDNCQSCVVDSGRNIWVAGYFTSQVSIGAFQLNSNGTTDLFLAKLNSNGTALFARSFPGAHYQTVAQLNIDSSDNLVLAGTYDFSLNLGGGAKQSSAQFQNTSFVSKYNNAGVYLWDVEVGGSGSNQANAVVAYSLNFVIVTGFFQSTAVASGQTITSQGSLNGYLLKLNA